MLFGQGNRQRQAPIIRCACPPTHGWLGTTAVASRATVMQPETVDGLIALEGEGAILGMDFLRSLDKWLVVGKNVSLIDDALF
jgi:hypothetical protein